MTTKEKIIYESLKLFSKDGFEAVSTRMIARAIGASDAVIYKHFKSKQEILDQIIEQCVLRTLQRRNDVNLENINWNNIEEICIEMFHFQTQDEWTIMFRQLLIVEQFGNPKMAELYQQVFIDAPIQSMVDMFESLMQMGYMKKGNAKVYAMQFYGPFFMYHTIGEKSKELQENLREHIRYFCENVKTNPADDFVE